MLDFTERDRRLIEETNVLVKSIMTEIIGLNGKSGIAADVRLNTKRIDRNRTQITRIWMVISAVMGMGGLGGGLWSLIVN